MFRKVFHKEANPPIRKRFKIPLQEIWMGGFWPLLIMLLMASCQSTEQRGRAQGPIKNGKAHGTWTEDHFNGVKASQGRYNAGLKSGKWRFWNEEGALQEESFWDKDQKHGKSRYYHPDGSLKAAGNYDRGQRQGAWTEWHPNGTQSREANYKDGNLDGVARSWFDSGSLERIENWKQGEAEVVQFHFNGNPSAKGNWNRRGDKDGKWVEYDLQGKVTSEAFYRDGLRLAGGG